MTNAGWCVGGPWSGKKFSSDSKRVTYFKVGYYEFEDGSWKWHEDERRLEVKER